MSLITERLPREQKIIVIIKVYLYHSKTVAKSEQTVKPLDKTMPKYSFIDIEKKLLALYTHK